MRNLISAFAIASLIFTTSCEKPGMEDELGMPKSNVNDKSFFTKSLNASSKGSSSIFVIRVVGTQDVLETLPNGTTIYETIHVEMNDNNEEIILGSTAYHIDGIGNLAVSINLNDKDGNFVSTTHQLLEPGQFEIQN